MAVAADPLGESHRGEQVRVAEGRGVSHVPRERTRTVGAVDLGEPGRDVIERGIPAHGLEAVPGPLQRSGDPVRVVDHLGERDALLTGKSRRQRVVLVGPQGESAGRPRSWRSCRTAARRSGRTWAWCQPWTQPCARSLGLRYCKSYSC